MAYWTKPEETRAEFVDRINKLHGFPENCSEAAADPALAAENEKRWAEFQERVKQRFDPPQDPYSMAQRLGFTVGDPDGERDVA